jgi:hypothetical protein
MARALSNQEPARPGGAAVQQAYRVRDAAPFRVGADAHVDESSGAEPTGSPRDARRPRRALNSRVHIGQYRKDGTAEPAVSRAWLATCKLALSSTYMVTG